MYKNKDIHLRYRFFLLVLNKPRFFKNKKFCKKFYKKVLQMACDVVLYMWIYVKSILNLLKFQNVKITYV